MLLIAEAVGYTLAKLDRPPDQFRQYLDDQIDGADSGALGASLLAFEEAPTAMAIVLLDGTIEKGNRRLRELLGCEEGDLTGVPAQTYSATSDVERAAIRDELLTSGVSRRRVTKLRRKDGSVFSAVASAVVARDDQGQPRYVIARAALVEPGHELDPA